MNITGGGIEPKPQKQRTVQPARQKETKLSTARINYTILGRIKTPTSLLTQYMKKKYDSLIEKNVNTLLEKESIYKNIDEIWKIYEQNKGKYGQLSYNNTDERSKKTIKHNCFFENFIPIVRSVYETIYPNSKDEDFVNKIAAKLFSDNSGKRDNLKGTIFALLEIKNESPIINFQRYMENEKSINPENKVLLDAIINNGINGNTPIDFKLKKDHTFLDHFNSTFAWDFFTIDKTHELVVTKFLKQYQVSKDINCLKNYLTIIYRVFYSFDFFNVDGYTYESDEFDDVEIEVKKYNSKITINVPDAGDSTPYASMKIKDGNKTFPYGKCYFSINNNDEPNNIHFNTPANAPATDLIEPNVTISADDSEIKICSYNLNWAGQKSKMISNHLNNILLSDIILLQELNINNSEIVIGTSDTMKTTDQYVPLTFSKDVYNILQKKRMIEVIGTYYRNSSNSNNTFVVPLYKSALKNKSPNYNIIYFPNRLSKSIERVKLNAIMYDSSKIKITDVFVGLLDSNKYLKHRHFCLCCKYKETSSNSEICVINIHLDTDYNKKIQLSEIKYLFSEIIQKERFFRNIDRYIIGGDLNTDAYDIALELMKIQKKLKNKKHELESFHKTILFNNIVTRGGLKSLMEDETVSPPLKHKDISKNNGMNLDNIIILDQDIIDHSKIKTYVGYNRTSGTTTSYFNHKDIKCHGIDQTLVKSKKEYCKTYFSDHSPIFAVFPKRNKDTTIIRKETFVQKTMTDATSKMDSSVVEEKRNIELLSSHKKIKLLRELLNVFQNNSNSAFATKYKKILRDHLNQSQ